MFLFCYNDCIPEDGSDENLISYFSLSIEHFNILKKQFPNVVDGIVFPFSSSDFPINNNGLTLRNCINYQEREIKKLALRYFTKYSVESFFSIDNEEELVDGSFFIKVNGCWLNAINSKVVHQNGGMLFTLPIHKDLERNHLIITDDNDQISEVANLYGVEKNTSFLASLIKREELSKLGNFDKLLVAIGKNLFNNKFKKNFDELTEGAQLAIIKGVNTAIDRQGITRLFADKVLIKDVTPKKEQEVKVYELRIFSPVATRMYFYETPNKVYLGSIEGKPKKKVQTSHISNALSVIKELIVTDIG